MQTQNIPIEEIKPYEKNAKKHDLSQIQHVANSIKEFGFVQPIVIDKNNEIVIGHCRYEASKLLGLDEVPVIKIGGGLTPQQVKALRLADNKTNESEWDFDLLKDELDDIIDLDMEDFGFDEEHEIDWADVDDLTDESYDEPEYDMLECPKCHHIDRKIHFKGVRNQDNKTNDE